jgi:hypothetical protein
MAMEREEKWELLIKLLQGIHDELQLLSALINNKGGMPANSYIHLPFKGSEIYWLNKAFIDAGGSPNENYKSLL